uniref:DENN domain containing 1C n=1 Tax=Oncorhynchus tshawytscha TaxID=74940 RepID=A0AAZ3SMC0_ONCTS
MTESDRGCKYDPLTSNLRISHPTGQTHGHTATRTNTMGSRLKENPDRTFYWFFEASCPIANDKDPDVLFQFPEDFSDEESRQTLPRFCFPYDIERVRDVVAVQHFTFVLTDLEGCQRFGFCRLTSSSHTCLCMLSYLPWFEVFYKLLTT